MPELPEVETTRRGIEPLIVGQTIVDVDVRQPRLRWPVDRSLAAQVRKRQVCSVSRRGKYLLVTTDVGTVLIHLGMSGNLRFLEKPKTPSQHDHVDFVFASGAKLRFNDPRRFGSVHFTTSPFDHWLLRDLGPEPLGDTFSADYLWSLSRQRRVAVKQFLMNGRIVVGVGNIYASEALFRAGIHPKRAAGRIAQHRFGLLVDSVQDVLSEAIEAGGTTLRDFANEDGQPGYFQQELAVYGRAGDPCPVCSTEIKHCVQGQRATYYCPECQR
ncbi:MAG: bifunctional DNA-formamidopyrimidine glycosylase/DNA-(apurinic or apyrimidinic site) lyase [Candidatus Rariloculaceae bacterium]